MTKRIPDTVTIMQFRAQPGEVLRAASHDGRTIVITKAGKPAARLMPFDDVTVIGPDGQRESGPAIPMHRESFPAEKGRDHE